MKRIAHNRITRTATGKLQPRLKHARWRLNRVTKQLAFAKDTRSVVSGYGQTSFPAHTIWRSEETAVAVVLHLYYVDMWPMFVERLAALKSQPFDIFVSVSLANKDFASEIKKTYPGAHVFAVPNRGRDVMPFMMLLPHLHKAGYQYILKFHSKKSTHRTDGSEWFTGIIDNLLPTNKKVMQQLLDALSRKETGVIGPSGEYLSLEVNFPANHFGVVRIMSKLFGKKVGQRIADHKEDYGFIAGTMFWARMDALAPALRLRLKPWSFDPEEGQIDATIAHALERVFTLIPEIEGRDIYEVDNRGLTKIAAYNSGKIPDWSDVYIGPQPKS